MLSINFLIYLIKPVSSESKIMLDLILLISFINGSKLSYSVGN